MAAALMIGLFSIAAGQQPADTDSDRQDEEWSTATETSNPSTDQASNSLLREGTRIRNQIGHFIQLTNDSAIFVDQDGRRLSVLKNLNLQRVVHMPRSTRTPEEIQWSLSGIITEFDGDNYLLITRIVRKSETAPRNQAANRSSPVSQSP